VIICTAATVLESTLAGKGARRRLAQLRMLPYSPFEPMLKKNRSAPNSAVIPVLYYSDVPGAVAWLTTALPFTERLRNSQDRRQLVHGNGAIVVPKPGLNANEALSTQPDPGAHSVTLRVTSIDELFERVKKAGARVLAEPAEKMYGERQCSFVNPWGVLGRSRRQSSILTQLIGAANCWPNSLLTPLWTVFSSSTSVIA